MSDDLIARLRASVSYAEQDMAADADAAEVTGERVDLATYEIALDLDDAKGVLAALAAKDAEIARLRDALAGLRSIVRVARSPDAPINMRQFRAAIDRADAALTGKEEPND